MNESLRAFHLEEFKQLKQEIAALLARIETLARLGLVVSAAVFSWLAVQGFGPGVTPSSWCAKLPHELFKSAWFLPFAFAVLSGIAAFAAYWRGREMATYLRILESVLGAEQLGWESTLQPKPPILTITASVFWATLLVGTFAVGFAGSKFVEKNGSNVCAAAK